MQTKEEVDKYIEKEKNEDRKRIIIANEKGRDKYTEKGVEYASKSP